MVSPGRSHDHLRAGDILCAWQIGWYFLRMKAAIDASGRVLIPKKVRDQAALPAEAALYLDEKKIVLEPAPTEIRIERRGHFHVAVPLSSVEPMDEQLVNSTLERIHSERGA